MLDLNRLRSEMEHQGMSQGVLAGAVNASPGAIQQILNGKTKHSRLNSKIARALGVSLDWLEGADTDPDRTDLVVHSNMDDMQPSILLYFNYNKEEEPSIRRINQRSLVFSAYWSTEVFGSSRPEKDVVMFRIATRDMAPTLLPGDDVAILNASAFDGDPDSIWFLQYEERTYVRRVRRLDAEIVLIHSDNPTYASFQAPISQVTFRGRVAWQGRSLLP